MTTTGKNIEAIIEKISILRTALISTGAIGLTNLHKYCEPLIADLVNIVEDLNLKNLNEGSPIFPGIDLGDKLKGTAFQVTATGTLDKIEHTLTQVLKHKHFTIFPSLKVFILGKKQNNYKLKTDTQPNFNFDPKTDIWDFDDFIKKINNCSSEKIQEVYDVLERELPATIARLKGEADKEVLSQRKVIDVNLSLNQIKLDNFFYCSSNIRIVGDSISAPTLFEELEAVYSFPFVKRFFPFFNSAYTRSFSSDVITFKTGAYNTGSVNGFKESVLEIKENNLRWECADYFSGKEALTNMSDILFPVINFFFFCEKLFRASPRQLEIDLVISTNSSVYFTTQGNSSPFSVKQGIGSYSFDSKKFERSFVLTNVTNESLVKIMRELIVVFVAPNSQRPFMRIDLESQEAFFNAFRNEWYKL